MKRRSVFKELLALALITRTALRERGPRFVMARAGGYARNLWLAPYYRRFQPHGTFSAFGRAYPYFYHLYNITWENERAVEIPLALDFIARHRHGRTLEVGNVLSWYMPVEHDVLDKYEVNSGVINEDIVDFEPGYQYDAIISISTLEHVGWDERPRDPSKALRAIEHLKELLSPGGSMLITVPAGYNPALDEVVAAGKLRFTRQCFMLRTGRTRWREAAWEEVRDVEYDKPCRGGNALLIGIYEKPGPVAEQHRRLA